MEDGQRTVADVGVRENEKQMSDRLVEYWWSSKGEGMGEQGKEWERRQMIQGGTKKAYEIHKPEQGGEARNEKHTDNTSYSIYTTDTCKCTVM